MLQAVVASLEQSQSPAQLRENLLRVRQVTEQFRTIRREAFQKTYAPPAPGQTNAAQPVAPAAAPSGLAPGNYVYDPASGQLRPTQ
jgi:hypothetical protein